MKNTGIVRCIDDLGRIVVPREIRRTLNIGKNEPLEMFVDGENLVLKKFSHFIDKEKLARIAASLSDSTNMPVIIATPTEILACARISPVAAREVPIPKTIDVVKPYVKSDEGGYKKVVYATSETEIGTKVVVMVLVKNVVPLEEIVAFADLTAKIISAL